MTNEIPLSLFIFMCVAALSLMLYSDQLNGTNDVNVLTISATKFVAPILAVIAIVMTIRVIFLYNKLT